MIDDIEGKIFLKYDSFCKDFIDDMLRNGVSLTLELKKDTELELFYYKSKGEKI